jgi:hypothetical protein
MNLIRRKPIEFLKARDQQRPFVQIDTIRLSMHRDGPIQMNAPNGD